MDQEKEGVKVVIGNTGDDLCPVVAPLSLRGDTLIKSGGIFFCCFMLATRQALTAANLPAHDFAGYSHCTGTAIRLY